MSSVHQVKVKLVTREKGLEVPEAPLFVPVSLKRYGLSEVVNQLLELEKQVPFDFLIDGQLLRTSLESYLASHGLSSENMLTLEYARSILPPVYMSSFAHDDWVSSVDMSRSIPSIATGSYDGIVRMWNHSGKVTHQLVGHNAAVKAVKWANKGRFVSAGADRLVCLWKYSDAKDHVEIDEDDEDQTESGKTSVVALLKGHTASVDDLAFDSSSHKILSASADTTIKLWSANYKELPAAPEVEATRNTASQKRRKLASAALPAARSRGALATLQGHTSPATGVVFHPSDSTIAYSVSQDHTVRTWDLTTSALVDTKTTSFPLLSIASLSQAGLLACGSSSRHINLLDPRTTTKTTQSQLIGHTNFVVSLAASPNNQYMFASGSHDGTTRIWDIRAQKSIYVISRESGEKPTAVYGVDWHESVGIASAGKDKKLQLNSADFGTL